LPEGLPAKFDKAVRCCLEKDLKQRVRDIGDVQLALDGAFETIVPGPTQDMQSAAFASRPALLLMAGLAAVVVGGGVFAELGSRPSRDDGVVRTSIALPLGHALVAGPDITRDGQRVAFASTDGSGRAQIYSRRFDEAELEALDGTEGAEHISFSPDGRWVAFYARGGFFKTRVDGGEPVRLANASSYGGGYWLDDGTILFTTAWNSGLYRIDENGGEYEPFLIPDRASSYAFTWPSVLPGGQEMLFNRWGSAPALMRLDLTEMTESVVVPGQWRRSSYVSSGHIVFAGDGGDILALPSGQDADQSMTPELVLENVHGGAGIGYARIAVSQNGTLVYAPLDASKRSLAIVDYSGRIEPVNAELGNYEQLSLSPDGNRVAINSNFQLFVHDLERGGRVPLVPELPVTQSPVWSRDGTRVNFASNHNGTWNLYSKAASGSGEVEVLLESRFDQMPTGVIADGRLVYQEIHESSGADIWLLPVSGDPEPWLVTPAEEGLAQPSPSGEVMAYMTNVSGRFEISIQDIDRVFDPLRISTTGGTSPMWSASGERLYFRQGHQLMVSDISTEPVLAASVPDVIFVGGWELSHQGEPLFSSYGAMSEDRFLMVRHPPESVPTRVNVIFNWFQELRERVPVP
jgi:serine/threonine-protein kinase